MHDSYSLYSLSHSVMVEISVMLISTILLCDIILLLFLLLFLYMFNFFLYVYGPCVCNKDILLLLHFWNYIDITVRSYKHEYTTQHNTRLLV